MSLAHPAAAQTVLSEASGNWVEASGDGFTFLARLTQNHDKARLTIWGEGPGSPATDDGAPQFDNAEIALGAFATRQELEVLDTGNGSIQHVVTEYADEEANGRTVLQIQFIDNQFTVVGYDHKSDFGSTEGNLRSSVCDVDLWNMTSTEYVTQRQLELVGFEALNASDWTFGAAHDRGFCARG